MLVPHGDKTVPGSQMHLFGGEPKLFLFLKQDSISFELEFILESHMDSVMLLWLHTLLLWEIHDPLAPTTKHFSAFDLSLLVEKTLSTQRFEAFDAFSHNHPFRWTSSAHLHFYIFILSSYTTFYFLFKELPLLLFHHSDSASGKWALFGLCHWGAWLTVVFF